jgi:hypothetical protein
MVDIRPLPRQMARVLAFIEAEVAAGRPFPSPSDIAAHMGWKNAVSGVDALRNLGARRRLIVTRTAYGKGYRRTYRLPAQDEPRQ